MNFRRLFGGSGLEMLQRAAIDAQPHLCVHRQTRTFARHSVQEDDELEVCSRPLVRTARVQSAACTQQRLYTLILLFRELIPLHSTGNSPESST